MYFVGIAMVLCSAAFFGTLGPVERIAMAAGVTPAGVSVVRAVFGAVVVSCYALRRNPRALTPRSGISGNTLPSDFSVSFSSIISRTSPL